MIPIRRRRQVWTVTRIVLFTVLALIVEKTGALTKIENVLDDVRIRWCQHHIPKPTDSLVHLDIDETALQQIGRWPWDRDELAEILEEVRLAGPKVVVLDIIFPDRSKPKYDEHGVLTDPDKVLADEIRKFDGFLLPASLTFQNGISPDPLDADLLPILTADPELTPARCGEILIHRGIDTGKLESLDRRFLIVRDQAIYDRIEKEMILGHISKDDLQRRLLPHADKISIRPVDHVFEQQLDRATRDRAFLRFALPAQSNLPPVLLANEGLTPLAELSKSARYGAFVDFLPEHVDGGTIRRVPLVAAFRGHLMPHMGLLAACAMMDVDARTLRMSRDSIIIPRSGAPDIVIPVHSRPTTDFGEIGMFMTIPMFGKKDDWETMYDFPRFKTPAQHVSMYEPFHICETRRRMRSNERLADQSLGVAFPLMDDDDKRKDAYIAAPVEGAAHRKLVATTISDIQDLIAGLSSIPDAGPQLKKKAQNLNALLPQLLEIARQDDALELQLLSLRSELREKLNGRAVFIGGTATGDVDIVPTALDVRCPGVVVHGAIFNGIMTRKMWRTVPPYVNYLIILAFSLITSLLVANLTPYRAFIAVMTLCVGYLLFNGFYLFDDHSLIVSTTGPLLTAILVWSGITVPNFITEIKERNRIVRRFSNYVDPSLVNYVIEHPDSEHFDGEAREMTMGFTDLAGFTTLTESLGTRTIPLLSEYIGKMVPIIRNNGGYVSRLMGDGIYFFFNAPNDDPLHASHAVETALQMHEAVREMNLTLPARGYPLLGLRAGICTGKVIVGDAGCKELFSDYTAMGDAVNTAARLESANKIFATRTLIIERTVELLEGKFLCRPIADVRVAGKTKGVLVYEPICRTENATAGQKQLAELSGEIVGKFQAADFCGCLDAVDRLEKDFGEGNFSMLYRELAERYCVTVPGDFCGQVILTEK